MEIMDEVVQVNQQQVQEKDHTLAHYQGMHMQSVAAADPRLVQLVALFARCDERGKKTILALAAVQVGFVARVA